MCAVSSVVGIYTDQVTSPARLGSWRCLVFQVEASSKTGTSKPYNSRLLGAHYYLCRILESVNWSELRSSILMAWALEGETPAWMSCRVGETACLLPSDNNLMGT